MTVIKYLLACLVKFFDALVGNGANSDFLSIAVATVIIALTFFIYFHLYWKVISPKCYRPWMCSVLTFLCCVVLWGTFILICVGGEWIIRAI